MTQVPLYLMNNWPTAAGEKFGEFGLAYGIGDNQERDDRRVTPPQRMIRLRKVLIPVSEAKYSAPGTEREKSVIRS